MEEIVLAGCTSTPLAGYLKALGVLRLLSGRFPEVQGAWRDDRIVLRAVPGVEAVETFFLQEYCPTPIMAPWNGGSGFFEKDNKAAVEAIRQSTSSRLLPYRECLAVAEEALGSIDRSASPKNEVKADLLRRLRALLPDDALEWLDASVLVSGEMLQYPPLLGTGGNDGRFDFTNNFMQRLCDVLSAGGDVVPPLSRAWLRSALHGDLTTGLLSRAIGQFAPGQAGGPNASTGFGGDSLVNPWDFVLTIEGAVTFAAAVVRRNADDPEGVLSYPFTVRAVGAGAGNVGERDAASARGELWMPLWRQPATYPEVRALLSEGRVALDRKPARDALDFVRAVHRLGSYRGITSYQRYGLLMRSGKAYLATPLARVDVSLRPQGTWLDELDASDWLTRFRRFAQGENVAGRLHKLRRQLEDALFDLSGQEVAPAEMQSLLTLLGRIQEALATSSEAREKVPPVPRLSDRWVQAADDGTTAFRIARALAGLGGTEATPLPLKAQLFPVHPRTGRWIDDRNGSLAPSDPFGRLRIFTPRGGNLPDTLIKLLARRLWLAEQLGMEDKPLRSPAGARLDDVVAFLNCPSLDLRIASLLAGLSLCSIPLDTEGDAAPGITPAAFALLKLVFTPDVTLQRLEVLPADEHVPVPSALLAQLAGGNASNRAVRAAWRRLRGSGLSPLFAADALPELGAVTPRRAAAALLIPLRFAATSTLARSVLTAPEPATA